MPSADTELAALRQRLQAAVSSDGPPSGAAAAPAAELALRDEVLELGGEVRELLRQLRETALALVTARRAQAACELRAAQLLRENARLAAQLAHPSALLDAAHWQASLPPAPLSRAAERRLLALLLAGVAAALARGGAAATVRWPLAAQAALLAALVLATAHALLHGVRAVSSHDGRLLPRCASCARRGGSVPGAATAQLLAAGVATVAAAAVLAGRGTMRGGSGAADLLAELTVRCAQLLLAAVTAGDVLAAVPRSWELDACELAPAASVDAGAAPAASLLLWPQPQHAARLLGAGARALWRAAAAPLLRAAAVLACAPMFLAALPLPHPVGGSGAAAAGLLAYARAALAAAAASLAGIVPPPACVAAALLLAAGCTSQLLAARALEGSATAAHAAVVGRLAARGAVRADDDSDGGASDAALIVEAAAARAAVVGARWRARGAWLQLASWVASAAVLAFASSAAAAPCGGGGGGDERACRPATSATAGAASALTAVAALLAAPATLAACALF